MFRSLLPSRRYNSTHVAAVLTDDLLVAYRTHSRDPAIALAQALQRPAFAVTVRLAVHAARVPLDEYDRWRRVATAPTLTAALDRAQQVLASSRRNQSPLTGRQGVLPAWALLAVLSKQPASQLEAFVAHRLAIAQPISPIPHVAVLILILAAQWLMQLHMYSLLHTVIIRLVRHRKHLRPYQLSILLRLIAHAEPNEELQRVLTPLLRVAVRDNMVLGTRTYSALLDNPAASSTVAHLVETHMSRLEYTPNLSHSRAFVRIYGESGLRMQAARHWRRIRQGEFFGHIPDYVSSEAYQTGTLEDYMKGFKNTRQVDLYVRYLAKNAARARHKSTVGADASNDPLVDADQPGNLSVKPALPTPDDIPPDVWLRVLSTAATDPRTPIPGLIALLAQGRAIIQDASKSLFATMTVIKSLLRRQAFKDAAPLLEDVLQQVKHFNIVQLTIAVEALTMLGRPAAAFRLLREHPRIDTPAVNAFMIALVRTGRPDAVFYLWDTLPRVFSVQPNAATLAILLKAARVARKCEGALQVALQDFGLARFLPAGVAGTAAERAPQLLSAKEAVQGLERLLERTEGRAVTGFWRGERAGPVALNVAWRIFTGTWPALADTKAPVRAVRRTAVGQALSPVADLYHGVHGGADGADVFGDGGDESMGSADAFPADEDGRTYFGIVPHDVAFRALLDLLAEEGRAGQVPIVLAWMRYLDVRPSKDTLAAAFVYWGEVALEGPLIERWRADGSQYGRLVSWVEDWVGRRGMPGREETQRALRRVRWFREMQTFGAEEREGEDDEFGEFQ